MANYYTHGIGQPHTEVEDSLPPVLYDEATQSLVSGDGNVVPLPIAHPAYMFHGCAAVQSGEDNKFRDLSGNNHAAFGANLSRTQAWANRANGYISTVDPAGGAAESGIRIPAVNFSAVDGEKLLVIWQGQATPEGSSIAMIGTSHQSADIGWAITARSDGRMDARLYDGSTSSTSPLTTNNAAGIPLVASEFHQFAVLIDGAAGTISWWVDGEINVESSAWSGLSTWATSTSNTVGLGKCSPSVGSTAGIATKTQALAILKWSGAQAAPSVSSISAAVRQMLSAPHMLILAGAL
jgi:hypothetical protein